MGIFDWVGLQVRGLGTRLSEDAGGIYSKILISHINKIILSEFNLT